MKIPDYIDLSVLVRNMKLGPLMMDNIENHAAKNLTAFTFLTLLMGLSISVFAGGLSLGFIGAGAVSMITAASVAVIGILVNSVLPTRRGMVDDVARNDTNKFVSYSVFSFIFTVSSFVALNLVTVFFMNLAFLDMLVEYVFIGNYPRSSAFTSILSAVIGTSAFHSGLYISGRVKAKRIEFWIYSISSALICAFVFYISHFVIFQ